MPDHEIEIKRTNVLRGPNIWAHQPVVEALIDLHAFEERPTDLIPGFTGRLLEALPTLETHRCSIGRPGGLIIRMREGTWMGHVIEHVALELLGLAGMEVTYGKTRSVGDDFPGQYRVVIEYLEEESGKQSIVFARNGCEVIASGAAYDFGPAIARLRDLGERGLPDPATQAIIDAGRRRKLPWIRRAHEGVLQLGYGKKGRRITGEHVARVAAAKSRKEMEREAEALLDELFPGGDDGRIPLVAITGTNGKTTVTRMTGHIMQSAGYFVGMPTTDGIYFNGVLEFVGDCSGPRSAEDVLLDPRVEVAVLETARGGIVRNGLAFDVCDVGVLLNVTADHIGLGSVHSVEDLAVVKGVVLEAVRRSGYGVVNADDPLVVIEAGDCDGTPIFFSRNPESPVLAQHVRKGGMASTLDSESRLVLREGRKETRLLPARDIPATLDGLIPFQVDNALAAAAAAWGAGVSPEVIAEALRTFRVGDDTTPGRLNIFEGPDYTIVIDFAHNPAAMRAQGEMVRALRERYRPERVIGVVAAPGDRRDQEIVDVAAISAGYFDLLIVRDDDDLRGREPGEVSDMMADAAREVLPPDKVFPVTGEFPALHMAFDMLRPGDMLVVCAVQIDQTLQDVRARVVRDSRG